MFDNYKLVLYIQMHVNKKKTQSEVSLIYQKSDIVNIIFFIAVDLILLVIEIILKYPKKGKKKQVLLQSLFK